MLKEKEFKSWEAEKGKLYDEINENQQLSKNLNDLITTRDEQVKDLEDKLKQSKRDHNTLADELKTHFQTELDKYIRLRDNQYEQEKEALINVLKEEHNKNLISYKEALGSKNHDIENLKESNQRLKKLTSNLKVEKEKYFKEKKNGNQKLNILKINI
eukprot:UN30570